MTQARFDWLTNPDATRSLVVSYQILTLDHKWHTVKRYRIAPGSKHRVRPIQKGTRALILLKA